MENIILALIAILGSAGAWKFFENRAKEKIKSDDWIKLDCQKRITKLENLLKEASEQKEDLRKQVLQLTAIVAELNIKVEFLEKEKKSRKKGRTNEE